MKHLFLLIVIFIISGCGEASLRIAPGYVEAYRSVKNAIIGYENEFLSQELIDNIPYASAVLRIGNGPEGLIILESIKDQKTTWISADDVYLTIKNGRIIKTGGLINNLTTVVSPFSSNFLKDSGEDTYFYYYSYDVPFLSDLKVESTLSIQGEEEVEVFEKKMTLILIEEKLESKIINWKAINKYWIDESNFVWKSEQHISPRLPVFLLEVTKKPSL